MVLFGSKVKGENFRNTTTNFSMLFSLTRLLLVHTDQLDTHAAGSTTDVICRAMQAGSTLPCVPLRWLAVARQPSFVRPPSFSYSCCCDYAPMAVAIHWYCGVRQIYYRSRCRGPCPFVDRTDSPCQHSKGVCAKRGGFVDHCLSAGLALSSRSRACSGRSSVLQLEKECESRILEKATATLQT